MMRKTFGARGSLSLLSRAGGLPSALLTSERVPLYVLIFLGIAVRLYRFTAPLLDAHAFRQTQTASNVWLWLRFGFHAFDYRVPVFGGGPWLLEFPSYQMVVYALAKIFGFHDYLGRVVSIGAFVVSALFLYRIAKKITGSRGTGLLSVFFFSFVPLNVFYYRAFLIDPFILMLSLMAFDCALRLSDDFNWPVWGLFSLVFLLALTGKMTVLSVFSLSIGISLVRVLVNRRTSWAARLMMITSLGIILYLGQEWIRYCDAVNRTTNGMVFAEMKHWFFGSTVTDLGLYVTILQRIVDNFQIVGLILIGLGFFGLFVMKSRYRLEAIGLWVGSFLSIVIFANLNSVHDYYQLPVYSGLCFLSGLGLWKIYSVLRSRNQRLAVQTVLAIVLALGIGYFLYIMGAYYNPAAIDRNVVRLAADIRANSSDEKILLLVNGIADPAEPWVLYNARRIGYPVGTDEKDRATHILDGDPSVKAIVCVKSGIGDLRRVDEFARQHLFQKIKETDLILVYEKSIS